MRPTILDKWKSRGGKSQRREGKKKEDQRREPEEGRPRCATERSKTRETLCFRMFWGPGGSKSRLGKAAGAEPSGQVRNQKLHAAVTRSRF